MLHLPFSLNLEIETTISESVTSPSVSSSAVTPFRRSSSEASTSTLKDSLSKRITGGLVSSIPIYFTTYPPYAATDAANRRIISERATLIIGTHLLNP